jgi:CspA family cold shock protein
MKTGTIKFFNESKGYGFITDTSSKDYFVHISALEEDIRDLEVKEGLKVTFNTVETPRGSNATDVSFE